MDPIHALDNQQIYWMESHLGEIEDTTYVNPYAQEQIADAVAAESIDSTEIDSPSNPSQRDIIGGTLGRKNLRECQMDNPDLDSRAKNDPELADTLKKKHSPKKNPNVPCPEFDGDTYTHSFSEPLFVNRHIFQCQCTEPIFSYQTWEHEEEGALVTFFLPNHLRVPVSFECPSFLKA